MIKYTYGGQFSLPDGTNYVGWYHDIKKKYYTGKRFVYGVSKKLKIIDTKKEQNYYEYSKKFKPIIEKYQLPQQLQLITVINNQNYDENSEIFLIKNKITKQILEITKKSYDKLSQNILFDKYSISIKIANNLSNISYNRKQLSKINDIDVINYLIKTKKVF